MFPGYRSASAKSVRIALSLLAICLLGSFAAAQTDNWVGSTGAWSDPTQWDSGVPVAGENINIGTTTASSTDDFSLSIGSLTLGNSADALTIRDGVTLTVGGNTSNAGSIQLASTGDNTYLLFNGNVTLTGAGTLTMIKATTLLMAHLGNDTDQLQHHPRSGLPGHQSPGSDK